MPTTIPPTPLTIAQAAQVLGLSHGRVTQLLARGALIDCSTDERAPGKRHKHHLDAASVEALRLTLPTREERAAMRLAHRQAALVKQARQQAVQIALAGGMVTTAEAARELGLTRQAVRGLVKRGSLTTTVAAGHRFVRREDLEAFKARRARL